MVAETGGSDGQRNHHRRHQSTSDLEVGGTEKRKGIMMGVCRGSWTFFKLFRFLFSQSLSS